PTVHQWHTDVQKNNIGQFPILEKTGDKIIQSFLTIFEKLGLLAELSYTQYFFHAENIKWIVIHYIYEVKIFHLKIFSLLFVQELGSLSFFYKYILNIGELLC